MRYAELYERLLEIPADNYVMHGSPHALTVIEPRQSKRTDVPAYGQFGVYATVCIEVALLYATIQTSRDEWGFAPQADGATVLDVRVPLGFAHGPGFIYILPEGEFEQVVPYSFVARKPVCPVEVLTVDADVLYEMIERNIIVVGIYDPALT